MKHGCFDHHIPALANHTGKVGGEAQAPVHALRVGLYEHENCSSEERVGSLNAQRIGFRAATSTYQAAHHLNVSLQ